MADELKVPRRPVTSTTIASAGYDPATSTLELEFQDGAVYRYLNVPPAVFDDLIDAPSKGTYINQVLKKAGYQYELTSEFTRSKS